MRSFTSRKGPSKENSLLDWTKYASPIKVARNILLMELAKYMPIRIKNSIYRLVGMKVGRNVAIAYKAAFDILFPELIEIGDNAIIGYGCTILAHEFLVKEFRLGGVNIGKNALIGANSTVLAGVTIGDNATVSAMSLVNDNVPAGAFVGGVPIRKLRRS